ncbi:MAG: hypothetical protein KJ749_07680 [Planctomycetes bacterium]|nr:hypothetical protein [Planctomycetota bacterium]
MPHLKTLLRFSSLALLVYVVLILPWPGVRETYRAGYCATGEFLFGRFGSSGVVRYEPRAKGGLEDVDVILGKRTKLGTGEAPVAMSTGRVGYVPAAVVVALILATPIPWRRKWRALVWGLVLVNLFVAFRSALQLLYWFSVPTPVQIHQPGPFWAAVLSAAYEFLFIAPACSFLVPVLVWAMVSFRPVNIDRIIHAGTMTRRPATDSK